VVEQRIKEVIASVMDIDLSEIGDNASPETIKVWDSIKQISLILSLEEEFNIHFSDEQTLDLINFKIIMRTIENILNSTFNN
jgi:acyl carrier protein